MLLVLPSADRMKRLIAAMIISMFFAVFSVVAEVQTKTIRIGTAIVHYKIVLPPGFDATKAYPAVLAFGGGPQNMEAVDRTLQRNWQHEAESRGYIVILPAAPDGILFFQGGEKIFPEFIVMMLANYKIQGNKFHVAGYSNGGTSAFLVAASYPQYFLSITAFPGYLLRDAATSVSNISKLFFDMEKNGFRFRLPRPHARAVGRIQRIGHGREIFHRKGPRPHTRNSQRQRFRAPIQRLR